MNERDDDLYQAASLYYVHGETMESIAHQLGVSRSTVSRLLKEARETGLVRITLAEPAQRRSTLAATLGKRFGVRCHVVGVKDAAGDVARLDRVAREAAGIITDLMGEHTVLGIAWGTTLAAVVEHLGRRDLPSATVVQLNGAANSTTTGIPFAGSIISAAAETFGAQLVHFPVPAFFDYAQTKDAMWRERSVHSVLSVQARTDIAVFGVGAMVGSLPSHVYNAGYLSDADLAAIKADGVVGDICTVLLREDGSWSDIPLNARASGPTPRELRRIKRRICVVAGTAKVPPTIGALRAKVATDLVIDEASARLIVARTGGEHGSR